jgi:hypothetical protein
MVHSDVGEQFTPSSQLECPACRKRVHVGTGGLKNLEAHRASKACQTRTKANLSQWNRPSRPNQSLDAFFKPRAPLNPPTVSVPPAIHPADVGAISVCTSEPGANPKALADPSRSSTQGWRSNPSLTSRSTSATSNQIEEVAAHKPEHEPLKEATKICQKATQLLHDLEAAAERIPDKTPRATQAHRLSVFAVDPRTCVAEDGEDDWLILNGMLKSAFGWGENEMAAAIPEMLNRGEVGLDGFIGFLRFFVVERALEGALFETKINALVKELNNR